MIYDIVATKKKLSQEKYAKWTEIDNDQAYKDTIVRKLTNISGLGFEELVLEIINTLF